MSVLSSIHKYNHERRTIMGWSWDEDGHKRDNNGSYWTKKEAENAAENGDLKRLSNGCFWNPRTGEEFWPDGTKK